MSSTFGITSVSKPGFLDLDQLQTDLLTNKNACYNMQK